MDFATLLGIFIGVAAMVWAILRDGSLVLFWDPTSVFIVVGGTLAATLVSHPMSRMRIILPVLRIAFLERRHTPEEVIPMIVRFAEKARREGLLAMEEEAESLDDPFLRKGIQLVVDGVDPELVRNVLQIEIDVLVERHGAGQRLFQTMGSYAPAFGMIGTLMGLIQMLAHLTNPDAIGSGLAVALLTTFYGALLANLVFNPIAGKLKIKSEQEVLVKQMMVEGILSIQAGENPRIVEEKLRAFLSHSDKARRQQAVEVPEGGVATSHVR
ncbi:MAG: flagellar motor protein [Firmicutes bacterium]|nr:flagellar motor protein [Bacillota bacterium]